jgi:hypothetical protein
MATRPVSPAPAPFIAPVSGSLDQRLAQMADAINRKADAGGATTAVPFVGIRSPDGTTWRLMVDDTGVVHTQAVPRP